MSGLKALGQSADANRTLYQTSSVNPKVLECFEWTETMKGQREEIEFDCPEFTSLCPVTGQPDFGKIRIDYTPDKRCVESKALKLYLMSYRNHGAFHESCCQMICTDLVTLLSPIWLVVEGHFRPRGGIAIRPRAIYRREGSADR